MRSKLLICAAIAAVGTFHWFVSVAHARSPSDDAKDAKTKAKPAELHADDKSIKRQSQWEDKVMGPDSKRADLERIARARAINEKAEESQRKQAALEAAAPAPKAAPAQPRKAEKAEVSLISPERQDAGKPHDISAKLETAAAQAPVKPVRPADDKFIDKLLHDESAPSKKHASANDKELENLLAGAKDKPAGRKRADSVDTLLKTAAKGPAMPEPRAQSGGLPEWAKQPEIAPTPAPPPPPVAVKAAPKNDGVIHVVQGAAGPATAASVAPALVAARAGRKTASKPPVVWNDPFAEKKPMASAQAPKKEAASRSSASTDSGWNDPFAEPDDSRKTVRHTAPAPAAPASAPKRNEKIEPGARPAGWKDPFTKASPEPTRAPAPAVAMRELGKNESTKWEIAARHPAHATASDTHAASGWGVIKKRAR
jgi:hypothetical protein